MMVDGDLLVIAAVAAAGIGAVNLRINIHMNFVSHSGTVVGGADVVVIVIIDGLQCLTDDAR